MVTETIRGTRKNFDQGHKPGRTCLFIQYTFIIISHENSIFAFFSIMHHYFEFFYRYEYATNFVYFSGEPSTSTNVNILSKKGVQKYMWKGFLYIKCRKSIDKRYQFWRCEKGRTGCKARLWTLMDGSFHSLRRGHTCSSQGDLANVVLQVANTKLKHLATTTTDRPREIRNKLISEAPELLKNILQHPKVSRRKILRYRAGVSHSSTTPPPQEMK